MDFTNTYVSEMFARQVKKHLRQRKQQSLHCLTICFSVKQPHSLILSSVMSANRDCPLRPLAHETCVFASYYRKSSEKTRDELDDLKAWFHFFTLFKRYVQVSNFLFANIIEYQTHVRDSKDSFSFYCAEGK